jgi:hypothetical protein
LIEAGADVNAKDDEGLTPLMIAAHYSTPEMVTLLIDAGADVNAKDDDGQTPLMYADRSPDPDEQRFYTIPPEVIRETIRILKDAGAKE